MQLIALKEGFGALQPEMFLQDSELWQRATASILTVREQPISGNRRDRRAGERPGLLAIQVTLMGGWMLQTSLG